MNLDFTFKKITEGYYERDALEAVGKGLLYQVYIDSDSEGTKSWCAWTANVHGQKIHCIAAKVGLVPALAGCERHDGKEQ